MKVLIVDDEPSILLTLGANLELDGVDVVTAGCGAEALAALQTTTFDLVLSDVRMPGMNGVELYRRIRAVCDTPVILMTAYAVQSLVDEAVCEGAFTVLRKPFDAAEVLPLLISAAARPMVLILDGARQDADDAAESLMALGLRARAAIGEASALRLVASKAVDVCVVELLMASAGEPPLIERLRVQNETLGFIALEGDHVPDLVRRVAAHGCVVWMRKPLAARALAKTIATLRARPRVRA